MLNFNALPLLDLDFMNKDHKVATELYNQIEANLKQQDVDGVITGLLSLQNQCVEHFAHEEREMRRFHFPPFKVHKQVHDRVLMEIDMVVKQLQNHRILIKVSGYIEHEFPSWFAHHLATMDKATAEFIAMQKQILSASHLT